MVQLTSPLEGFTLDAGSPLTLTASVNDPSAALARVSFFVDEAIVADIGPAGPFVFNGVAPATAGTYRVSVIATDSLGRYSTSARTITVQAAVPGAPAPTAEIITDLNNRLFASGALVPVSAAVSAPAPGDEIARVDFYADDVLFASLDGAGNPIASRGPSDRPVRQVGALPSGATYSATFTMPGGDKLINIVAVAVSKLGRSQTSAATTVQSVSATTDRPPVLSVELPNGAARVRVGGRSVVPVTVSDPDAGNNSAHERGPVRKGAFVPSGVIAKMEYYLNALKVKDSAQAPFGFDFSPPSAGIYILSAIATDGAGLATVSAPVRVEAFVTPQVSVIVKGSAIAMEGGAKAKFLISRDGSDFSEDLTVTYKLKGTAKNGTDYEKVSSSVVIPAGQSNVKLKIKANDDALKNGPRSVELKLLSSPSGDYDVGSAKKAAITIIDND